MIHICSGPQGGQEDNCCRLLTSWLAPSANFKVCGLAWCLLFSSFDTSDVLTTIHWEGVGQKWFCVTSCIMIWQFDVYFTPLLHIRSGIFLHIPPHCYTSEVVRQIVPQHRLLILKGQGSVWPAGERTDATTLLNKICEEFWWEKSKHICFLWKHCLIEVVRRN